MTGLEMTTTETGHVMKDTTSDRKTVPHGDLPVIASPSHMIAGSERTAQEVERTPHHGQVDPVIETTTKATGIDIDQNRTTEKNVEMNSTTATTIATTAVGDEKNTTKVAVMIATLEDVITTMIAIAAVVTAVDIGTIKVIGITTTMKVITVGDATPRDADGRIATEIIETMTVTTIVIDQTGDVVSVMTTAIDTTATRTSWTVDGAGPRVCPGSLDRAVRVTAGVELADDSHRRTKCSCCNHHLQTSSSFSFFSYIITHKISKHISICYLLKKGNTVLFPLRNSMLHVS